MKKSMKKSLVLTLTMVVILSMTALTGYAGTTSAKVAKTYKIGYNYFGSASYALLALANNSKVVIDAYGNKAVSMDDNFSVEKIVQDVENMISSGVDGLIIWMPVETLYTQISKICKDAKVPFVLNDKVPTNPAIIKELKANPYFVGAVSPENAAYGDAIAKFALSKGYKNCIITSSGVGDASDTPRLNAFKKAFQAAGGTILTELHADSSDQAQQQIEDALVANPNPDFIYGTGSDFGVAACNVLKKHSDFKTKVLTSGLDKSALALLGNSPLEMINGDDWICGTFSAILLQNWLDKTPIKDAKGNVPWITNVGYFNMSSNQIDLFNKFFIKENCYSKKELLQMSTKNNPKFNYNAFVKALKDYSINSRLKQKMKEGKVTAAQLKAAGIK